MDNERIIQGVCCANRDLIPGARVGKQAIAEDMPALIGHWIGRRRTAQQTEAHDIVANIMAVLAIIEQADAVAMALGLMAKA